MSRPELVRNGDEFGLTWEDLGIAMIFDQLRETSYGLKGEVQFHAIGQGVMNWGNINLSSISERATIAGKMKAKMRAEWPELIDYACTKVAIAYREGEPLINLGGLPEGDGLRTMVPRMYMPDHETTTIFAAGGSLKSYIVLMVAVCVATGHEFPWGGFPARTGNVIFFDYETEAQEHGDRLKMLCRGLGIDIPQNIFYRHQVRPVIGDIAKMRQQADKVKAVMIVLDSLGGACGADLKEQAVVQPTYQALRQMNGAMRLVTTHLSKGSDDGSAKATPFGSVYVTNESRSVWELKRSEAASDETVVSVGLYHFKVNNAPLQKPFGMRFYFDNEAKIVTPRMSDLMDADDLAAKTTVAYRIRQALRGGAMTVIDLAEEIAAKEDTVQKTLRRMKDVREFSYGRGAGNKASWGLKAQFEDEK